MASPNAAAHVITQAVMLAAFVIPAVSFAQTTSAYTIETRSAGEMMTDNASTSSTVNTNTSAGNVQDTIAANPGLAEALQKNGVMVDEIGAISILPNDKVVVF